MISESKIKETEQTELLREVKKIVKHMYLGNIINRELPIDFELWGISEIVRFTGFQYEDIQKLICRKDFPKKVEFNYLNWSNKVKKKDRWFSKDIKNYLLKAKEKEGDL